MCSPQPFGKNPGPPGGVPGNDGSHSTAEERAQLKRGLGVWGLQQLGAPPEWNGRIEFPEGWGGKSLNVRHDT